MATDHAARPRRRPGVRPQAAEVGIALVPPRPGCLLCVVARPHGPEASTGAESVRGDFHEPSAWATLPEAERGVQVSASPTVERGVHISHARGGTTHVMVVARPTVPKRARESVHARVVPPPGTAPIYAYISAVPHVNPLSCTLTLRPARRQRCPRAYQRAHVRIKGPTCASGVNARECMRHATGNAAATLSGLHSRIGNGHADSL